MPAQRPPDRPPTLTQDQGRTSLSVLFQNCFSWCIVASRDENIWEVDKQSVGHHLGEVTSRNSAFWPPVGDSVAAIHGEGVLLDVGVSFVLGHAGEVSSDGKIKAFRKYTCHVYKFGLSDLDMSLFWLRIAQIHFQGDELIQKGQNSPVGRRALSSAVRATHVGFHQLACVKHPPEAASPLRAPEETHVTRSLF